MNTELAERQVFDAQPVESSRDMVEVASSRQAQEVQASMMVAKKFPRDDDTAIARIHRACKRTSLAEQAMYAYPRGNTTVEGASIRLAEVLAQNWGNLDFGIVELSQKNGESTVMAYAWDMETNTRATKVFQVKHERHTKRGKTRLTDPRDIYELTANQGARRLRACILAVIPRDVQETALEECNKTLRGNSDKPIRDRVRDMVLAFDQFGVTKEMIETRLGHVLDVTTETELVNLRKIYSALKDNMAAVGDYFEVAPERGSKVGKSDLNGDAPDDGGASESGQAPETARKTKGRVKGKSKAKPQQSEGVAAIEKQLAESTEPKHVDYVVNEEMETYLKNERITREEYNALLERASERRSEMQHPE